jgi:hypothetical protein
MIKTRTGISVHTFTSTYHIIRWKPRKRIKNSEIFLKSTSERRFAAAAPSSAGLHQWQGSTHPFLVTKVPQGIPFPPRWRGHPRFSQKRAQPVCALFFNSPPPQVNKCTLLDCHNSQKQMIFVIHNLLNSRDLRNNRSPFNRIFRRFSARFTTGAIWCSLYVWALMNITQVTGMA